MSEKNIKKWYLDHQKNFQKVVNEDKLSSIRADSTLKFEGSSFPSKKDEEWKYTNISPILKKEFIPSPLIETGTIENIDFNKYLIPELNSHLLVFINGIFSNEKSLLGSFDDKIIVDSFKNVAENNPEFLKLHLSKKDSVENSFNHLNNSFIYDGFVIYIPQNKIIDRPIHILNIADDSKSQPLIQPRNLIVAEENSQAYIINEHIGSERSEYFTNIITEISIDKGANVTYYKIQNESNSAFHIDKTDIVQRESSVFNHFSLSFGANIARNDINTKLDGENIELHLYGLYLGNEDQHIDHHTFIDHSQPNCESNELYKGILDDRARGVFSGKILVDRIAQKTNAFQSNKSVLLSDEASIDAKPQLEIYADDVKCSHGATVGKLDEQAFFYIRSRGVSEESARSMLIRAFVDDVVSEIKLEPLKEKVNHTIFEHLHREEF